MATVAQAFLAVVFFGAAAGKAADYGGFLRTLSSLPWLPLRLARFAARAIPMGEFALGAAFFVLPSLAAVAALAMLGVFSTVAVIEIASGRKFECGCFGVTSTRGADWTLFARNGVIAAAAIAVLAVPLVREPGAVLVGVAAGSMFLLAQIGGETLGLIRR